MTKRYLTERIGDCNFDGMTRQSMNVMFDAAEATHENVRIDSEVYGYDGAQDFFLVGQRWETEEEVAARLKEERRIAEAARKAEKAKAEAKERKQFERLKKKFEDSEGLAAYKRLKEKFEGAEE